MGNSDISHGSALSQVQTEAFGPIVGKVSESLTLTCHISGVPINNSSYAWDWIRQTPGKHLQHIALLYPFTGLQHVASSFQTRVTSSADPSRNQLLLAVLSPSAADTATYFCSTRELEKGPVLERQGRPGQKRKGEGVKSSQVCCGCLQEGF
uniref:Ig-like domain-containing protein n=1 Tax=Calidris pygmaea TaxID=425635 RepID=A0A8C3KTZ6_9CHAR